MRIVQWRYAHGKANEIGFEILVTPRVDGDMREWWLPLPHDLQKAIIAAGIENILKFKDLPHEMPNL